MGDLPPLATSKEVAARLNVSPRTLDQWSWKKTGPKFVRVGRHRRYDWLDVEEYLRKNKRATA